MGNRQLSGKPLAAWANRYYFAGMISLGFLTVAVSLGGDWLASWPRLPAELIVGVGLICLVPLVMPLLVTRCWNTRRLAEDEHRWLHALVADAGLPRLSIRVWDTSMRRSNAVVVGFIPPLRILMLTDRLLRDFPPDQLRLIVLHELMHIKRWHVAFRILAILPGWAIAGLLVQSLGGGLLATLLGQAVGITATLRMLRLAAYVTEHDADRQACGWSVQWLNRGNDAAGVVPPGQSQPREQCAPYEQCDLHGATDRVGTATASGQAQLLCRALLRVVGGGSAAARSTWLHPSVDDRCLELLAWGEWTDQTTIADKAALWSD